VCSFKLYELLLPEDGQGRRKYVGDVLLLVYCILYCVLCCILIATTREICYCSYPLAVVRHG
jgi:hypothetical protein